MTNFSDVFSSAPASPIRSMATGFFNSLRAGGGAGEDTSYLDITIPEVANIAKCSVSVDANANSYQGVYGGFTPTYYVGSSFYTGKVTARLTSPTNLRISISSPSFGANTGFTGRYQVVEFN